MQEPIKVMYQDIEITYYETDDTWRFTVGNRDRSTESLADAKEQITKYLERKAKNTGNDFTRQPAYFSSYGGELLPVEVTSQALGSRYSTGRYYWISKPGGDREKVSIDQLLVPNQEVMDKVVDISKQLEELSRTKKELINSLPKWGPKSESEEEGEVK